MRYYCDAPYDGNHKCAFKESQLFTVEIAGLDEADTIAVELEEQDEATTCAPYISLSALTGDQTYHTMRIKVMKDDFPIHTLVDSGSTHNFLDISLARKLGCENETIPGKSVMVADGNNLLCHSVCKKFTWSVAGHEFTTEVMLIPLGSCDMVLGIQWLSTLGTIAWDFKHLTMNFSIGSESVELRGVPNRKLRIWEHGPSLKLLSGAA